MDSIFEHAVYVLGSCSWPRPQFETRVERSNEEGLIDLVENAQLAGEICNDKDCRKAIKGVLRISKHGMKMMSCDRSITLHRIPLLNIVFTVSYSGISDRCYCAVVENLSQTDKMWTVHVFQCDSQQEGDRISNDVNTVFNLVREECQKAPQSENCQDI